MALRYTIVRLLVPALTLAALLVGLLGVAPRAAAQDARLVWAAVPGLSTDVTLQDVFMVGADAAWAAGHTRDGVRGLVYRLSLVGGRWQATLDAEFDRPLFAIVGLDRERAVIAGDRGFIARRDGGGGWTAEGPGTASMRLEALQLFEGGRAGWALGSDGDRPLALRYGDGRWSTASIEAPGGTASVSAVHFAPGAGWAVGSHIWRLDGNSWRLERMPDFCGGVQCPLALGGVRAVDAQRAWLVGARVSTCAICQAKALVAARGPGGWVSSFPDASPMERLAPVTPGYDSNQLTALYFVGEGDGLAVGHRRYTLTDGGFTADTVALRYTGGTWRYETILARSNAVPRAVFMADATRALVVGEEGLILSYGYGPQAAPAPAPGGHPARPVPDPGQPGVRYFAETGHTLRGVFLRYWEANGGLARFGYPLTEEFAEVSAEDGRSYTVQYFERARFEYHPEYAGTQYEVLLGLLGHWVTAERKGEAPFQPATPDGRSGSVYFPETRHNMAREFVGYWQRNGGLPIYGYPISEPFYEVNAADGRTYLVQYFERNRFEYHPELAGTPYEVLLGLLGSEYLRAQGWR